MESVKMESRRMMWVKVVILAALSILCFYAGFAHAEDIGTVATKIKGSMGSVVELITAASYVAGVGFAVGAILKFKAHKDQPTQIPIGTPIALIFIAAALIFLPSIIKTTGGTIFEDAESGGPEGVSVFQ